MKTISAILFSALLTALSAKAAPDRVMTIKASVDGMVCAFCAQGLTAHFRNHDAISNIHVSLGRNLVILEERKGKSISDEEIAKAVERAGFDAPNNINRVATPFDDVKNAED